MTEENRRANLADSLALAAETFRAAEALVGLGMHRDAVSRTYYALFYLVQALLFSRGQQARTHAGVLHLFNVEFVLTGAFDASNNALLTNLQKLREAADYDAKAVLTAEVATSYYLRARTFETLVRDWRTTNGWLA